MSNNIYGNYKAGHPMLNDCCFKSQGMGSYLKIHFL